MMLHANTAECGDFNITNMQTHMIIIIMLTWSTALTSTSTSFIKNSLSAVLLPSFAIFRRYISFFGNKSLQDELTTTTVSVPYIDANHCLPPVAG